MQKMASNEDGPLVPLSTLYLQVEYAESSCAVLGLGHGPTELEVREAYRTLALRLHPDKASSDNLRELHTSLFQKVQEAYNNVLSTVFSQSDEGAYTASKRLPETEASLHARNVAFREALRSERERALKAKHDADARQAAKLASLKAKNERLSERREERSRLAEQEKVTAKTNRAVSQQTKQPSNEDATTTTAPDGELPADWEQEADRLEEEAHQPFPEKLPPKPHHKPTNPPHKRPPQNIPTASTARPLWDAALDERLVTTASIQNRWDKLLLSGGRIGTASLSQRKQRSHNAAARMHKATMALCEDADHLVKPALTGSNRTFSGMVEEALMEGAFVEVEGKAERRTERLLEVMEGDVRGRYLIDGEEGEGRGLGIRED